MFLFYKRFLDLLLSILLIVTLLPILIISTLSIILIDHQNPFFLQKRSGINSKNIYIIKFQTMKLIHGKKKVTKLGNILRISKVDELPQLINIIRNDMSLIGPRPLYIEFNNHYKKKHKQRLTIKPGLSGLAQVKVKDSTDWNKKFNYDVIYIKKASFKLDSYIIIKTIIMIFNSLFFKKKRALETIRYRENFFENYCK